MEKEAPLIEKAPETEAPLDQPIAETKTETEKFIEKAFGSEKVAKAKEKNKSKGGLFEDKLHEAKKPVTETTVLSEETADKPVDQVTTPKTEETKPAEKTEEAKTEPKPDNGYDKKRDLKLKETIKQRNQAYKDAEELRKQLTDVQSQLAQLKSIKEEAKSQKDLLREVVLEDKLSTLAEKQRNDLESRISTFKDPDSFRESYNYYVPLMEEKVPKAVEYLAKLNNYDKVLECLFDSINNGHVDFNQFISLPLPVMMTRLKTVSANLEKLETEPVEEKHEAKPVAESKKEQIKSVVPDLKTQTPEVKSTLSEVKRKYYDRETESAKTIKEVMKKYK